MSPTSLVAACLLASLAASLAGCFGGSDPNKCPELTGLTVSISYPMELLIDEIHVFNDFDADIVTSSGQPNNVSIVVDESLVDYLDVSQDEGGSVRIGFVDDRPACSSGASAQITVGQWVNMVRSESSGSVTVDYVNQRLEHYGSAGTLTGSMFGNDFEVHAASGSTVTIPALHCNSVGIVAEGAVSVEELFGNYATIEATGGKVTIAGSIVVNELEVGIGGGGEVDLGSVTTQSADIEFKDSAGGSLTGLQSQHCLIKFLEGATGSVNTTVLGSVVAECDGGGAPDSLVIQGGANESGSCFAGAATAQALV